MAEMDGGGFPLFHSYHDCVVRRKTGAKMSRDADEREAFRDFAKAIKANPNWKRGFTAAQAQAIERALIKDGPKIDGFTWHHHQDYDGNLLQLVSRADHRATGHYGGMFVRKDIAEYGFKDHFDPNLPKPK